MDTQKRYTDTELLTLLRVLASDRNMKPTQRDILGDDRLPTHHTFNKRFGSVNSALDAAGLSDLAPSSMHMTVESLFNHYGLEVIAQYEQVGPLMIDFTVRDARGAIHHIDIIDMDGVVVEDEIAHMRSMLITPYSDAYIQIKDVGGAINFINSAALSGNELSADIVGE